MMHFRPEIIESLTSLWVALPLKAPTSGDEGDDKDNDPRARQHAILDAYCYALRSLSADAVRNTIDALREGKIKEASKRFCPTSAELAVYARDEQSRLDAINRPRMVSHRPVEHTFKDWRHIQRERTRELVGQGYVLAAENVTHEQSRRFRKTGTLWFWAVQECWEPTR